jgi:hypothetical protein
MAMLSLTAITVKKKLDFDEGPAQAEPWCSVNGGADDARGRERLAAAAAAGGDSRRRDWMGPSGIEEAMRRCTQTFNQRAQGDAPDSDDDLAPPAARKQHRGEGGHSFAGSNPWAARHR